MKRTLVLRVCAAAAMLTLCVGSAQATMMLNEIFVNPSGGDNGFEFIELKSSTGGVEAMTGLTLLVIEGEGTGAGTVDQALSLNSFSTGTNGLFLRRDAATVLSPAPDAATVVSVGDFAPDLENGGQSYLIVDGFTGLVGTDYDAANDGLLDSTPWTSVIDAVGYRDNGGGDVGYAAGLGFVDFPDAPSDFDTESVLRLRNGDWILADVSGTSPGPFSLDPTETIDPTGALVDTSSFDIQTLTPGGVNPIPEPSTVTLVGLAVLAAALGRRFRVVG